MTSRGRPKGETYTRTLTVRFDAQSWAALESCARDAGLTVSDVMRRSVIAAHALVEVDAAFREAFFRRTR